MIRRPCAFSALSTSPAFMRASLSLCSTISVSTVGSDNSRLSLRRLSFMPEPVSVTISGFSTPIPRANAFNRSA